MTCFRLHCQWRKRRLWLDDYFVTVGLIGDIFCIAGILLRTLGYSPRAFTLAIFFVYFVTWTTRIGIGLSITRNCAPIVEISTGKERKKSSWPFHAMNLSFGVMCMITTIPGMVSVWWCTATPKPVPGQCRLQKISIVTGVVTNIVSDVLLIIVPLYVLRRVKLTGKQRRMIHAIFAASAICSAPSLAIAAGQHIPNCLPLVFQLKAPITLMVSNLLVVVTYVYARFGKEDDHDPDGWSRESDKPILTTCVITELP